MQCSDCDYQLSPFDKDCPRCKVMSTKGAKPSKTPPIELNFDAHPIDKIEERKLKCANCNNPLECGWLACPKCGTQFEAPVPQLSPGKSEAAPPSTIVTSSRFPVAGIIAGLIIMSLLGFLIVISNNRVTAVNSSNTSLALTQSTSDNPISFSEVSVTQGPPSFGGKRNWSVGITVHNNSLVPLKTQLVDIYFDDFSSITLELAESSSVKMDSRISPGDPDSTAEQHILHPPGYSPPILGPGKSAQWNFSSDDITDNAGKKPKKLIISTYQGPVEVPIPPD